ncbi:NAD(P)-binding protein [Viridothelium virens]|uniref:NAD(P)-binding protein n=1 Tax=Viridothelium virens TaxID=1048519 RepID=A0A6A6HFN2_VIRVR|nr:NAD(P)-binding protein [Viridothelium virens]
MDNDTTEKVIIVTGASRGIGLAITQYLLSEAQCHVVAVARSEKPLQDLERDHHQTGRLITQRGDVADMKFCGQIADETMSRWGRIDGLVVNHGVLDPVKRISESFVAEWKEAFDINFFGSLALIKACLPFVKHSRGRIIICSSGAATKAYSTWGAYGASKAVLNHLVQTLAVEEPEVCTISVRPGIVNTMMQTSIRETHRQRMDEADAKKFVDLYESGGLLQPEQPGRVMGRLVLNATSDLSGKFIDWQAPELKAF